MKRYIPVLVAIGVFLCIKLSGLSVRASDSNIYFYTATELLHGKLLYKDIFFTNFPLVPAIHALYVFILQHNLVLYYFTAAIEVGISSFLIYKIALEKSKDIFIATGTSCLYLFSFIILSTSDHQTGVFTASLFALLSYYTYTHKRVILTGIFAAAMILTKAYFLPLLVTYLVLMGKNRDKSIFTFIAVTIGSVFLILLPFLVFAPKELYADIFQYSLTRGAGVSKLGILIFFIIHDPLIFTLLVVGIVRVSKELFFGIFYIFSLIFLVFYQDIYYLYLNFMIPFVCLSSVPIASAIKTKWRDSTDYVVLAISMISLVNIVWYYVQFQEIGRVHQIESIKNEIVKLQPNVLYGTNDIAPAVSFLSNTPLLNTIIDTNANIFRKKYLNATKLTKDAIAQKALLIGHGAYYPQLGVDKPLIDEIFDEDLVKKSCRVVKTFPVVQEGMSNELTLAKCE
ncbi:hypothetical protein HGA88_05810 [Candidatus Roizmanbacteria bacterium]|nr:hypothetical protein [Candidatus Roizmanbacteria bacterium]